MKKNVEKIALGMVLTVGVMFIIGYWGLALTSTPASAQISEIEKETADAAFAAADKGKPDPAWRGKKFTIGVYSAGPRGAISGPLYFWRPYWEKITGATYDIVEIPFGCLTAAETSGEIHSTAPLGAVPHVHHGAGMKQRTGFQKGTGSAILSVHTRINYGLMVLADNISIIPISIQARWRPTPYAFAGKAKKTRQSPRQ